MLRERELSEKINGLTKLLDDMKIKAESEKRELEEKLNLSQDELSIIRNSRSYAAGNESFHNRSANTSLQDEVESLRCVLELKQSEISELRKTNCELQRTADDATSTHFRCSALESRVEDLQVQLHAKNEEEK
jgi:predicted RNase H-like nuclease (RuvC/YqgF family)